MRKLMVVFVGLIIFSTAFCQYWRHDEWKLGTLSFGPEIGIGDAGHFDLALNGRMNMPGFEYLIVGISFHGGAIFHNTEDLTYVDIFGDYYDCISDLVDASFEILAGAELMPRKKINPFFVTGIEFWKYSFTATNTSYDLSIDVSSDGFGTALPIILGCDYSISKHFALTGYLKFTPYLSTLRITVADYDEYGYLIGSHYEDIGKWRGVVTIGFNLSIPISLRIPKDSDHDGVWDEFDECPNTPLGVIVDERGCPIKRRLRKKVDVEKALVEKGIFVTNEIYFKFNSAEIEPESYPLLNQIGRVLERHKEWKLEIAGHTDSIGTEEYNLKLSQRRAEAVRKYLLEHFDIFARNLIAKGYGESRPIADNGTSEGRARNRRVEFRIIR